MNHSRSAVWRFLAAALALPLAALALVSCDIGAADSTSAVPSDSSGTIYNFAGLYMNATNKGDVIVFPTNKQSGKKLTWLRLLQYGNELEAYDNAGKTWNGSISTIQSGTANFSLNGSTTAGQAVEIAGTLIYKDQQSEMNATWIEPAFYGSIFATATVSPAATNNPATSVTISPSSATIPVNGSRAFTASGGNGTYTWTQSNSARGTLSSTTGTTITYQWESSGTDILTVTSGAASDSATIVCQ